MLKEPRDKNVIAALARLQSDGDWMIVEAWLKESLATQREQNDKTIEDAPLRQGQGCAMTLSTLLTSVSKSPELHRKIVSGNR